MFWGGLHDAGGLIVRQMRAQGVKAPLMGGDGITDDEFAAIAGPGAEGTLMTFSPDPRTNPANKTIIELFRTKRMFEPQAYTLYSYASVQIIKQAAEKANSLDPKKVAEVMRSGMVFNTVLGDLSFDKQGRRRRRRLRRRRREEGPLRALCLAQGSGRPHQLFRGQRLKARGGRHHGGAGCARILASCFSISSIIDRRRGSRRPVASSCFRIATAFS